MSLDEYRRKRRPGKTPEPFGSGDDPGDRPRFVIQRHDARRLHYDFRLERDGALASWAVPKGVPLRKGERHLAVHVEDHPLEYADFAGVIPAGQYGAGTVEIWDRGTYDLLEEKRDGGLTVRLYGERLEGVWTLVPASLDGDPKNWLLLRKDADDGAAGRRYQPMLATSSDRLPSGEGWVFEPKWDGFRAIVTISGGEVTLTSRNGNDLTERFRDAARAAAHAITTPDAVLDGEICVLDHEGRSRFSLLQESGGTVVLVLFDVLEVDSVAVVDEPLAERRKQLEGIVGPSNEVFVSPQFDDGAALLAAARDQELEGVVAKKTDSSVQARTPLDGLAQAQAAPDTGGRDRRVHARAGTTHGRVRRARRREYTTQVCCGGPETSGRASRTARSRGCWDCSLRSGARIRPSPRCRRCRACVGRTSRGSSRSSSRRSSSPSGRTRAGCARRRTCACRRTSLRWRSDASGSRSRRC